MMKQVVKVKFLNAEGEPIGKEYCYFCTIQIALGDKVKAPVTPQNADDEPTRLAVVSQINVPEEEIEPYRKYAKTITERVG